MKILRFPHPPAADRAARDGSARPPAGGSTRAGDTGLARDRPAAATDDPRLLWALTVLQRPAIESLLARRAPARGVLAAFRWRQPFGHNDLPDAHHP